MAKNPERRRPPGKSPILIPLVEQLNMPVNTPPESALDGPENTEPALERLEGAAVNAESLPENAEQAEPEQRLPEASHVLPPEDDPQGPIGTDPLETGDHSQDSHAQTETAAPLPAPEAEAEPAPAAEAAEATLPAEAVPEPAPAPEPEMYIPPNMKQPVTINMRTALKLRAETAVLRTGHLPGGHRSQVMLIEAALERELARLEDEFNNGEPFPPNLGSFRTGRPLGS